MPIKQEAMLSKIDLLCLELAAYYHRTGRSFGRATSHDSVQSRVFLFREDTLLQPETDNPS